MTSRQILSAMQRQQKITLGKMRSSGDPTRLIVYSKAKQQLRRAVSGRHTPGGDFQSA
jgi:hypothetical protein